MSYQKDYILRMIEMIGDLIAGILGLIKKGNFQKAGDSIEQAYQDYLKEDAAFFRRISLDDLNQNLIQEHNYTHDHLEILAELFYAEAELLNAQSQTRRSLEFYEKSVKLYQFVIQETETFSIQKNEKVELLQQKIEQLKKRSN
ncbi:hypothetical protein ACUNWD_08530 [Sunxiuqinia sp. A32]|uniref:hypothetical protein n=1 Tax=Sunxiuqinia sp. A32 TaxID=3461496 RepID=UPI0040460181